MRVLIAAVAAAFVLVPVSSAAAKRPFTSPRRYERYLLAQAHKKHVRMKCLTAFTYQVTCVVTQRGVSVMARYVKVGPHRVRECVTAPLFGTECKTRTTAAPGV